MTIVSETAITEQPSFAVPPTEQTTGRSIITLRREAMPDALAMLRDRAGISDLPSTSDFEDGVIATDQMDSAGGAVFQTFGIMVVTTDDAAVSSLNQVAGTNSSILDIEPERIYYALSDGLSLEYLRGYRDAVNHLFQQALGRGVEEEVALALTFVDDAQSTWGLKATKAVDSPVTGQGIKIAVLDTGLDLTHPDFQGRSLSSRSFISGETVQDGNAHGTHCIGTACGRNDHNGRRYGVAGGVQIFVGKVLSDGGSGPQAGIIQGMEWAVNNGCEVISMSLGNRVPTPSTAYTQIGDVALENGCVIVAAAGNHRQSFGGVGTVGQPANSPSIMAVGAVDNQLRLAPFSGSSGTASGAKVDIVGPGVAIYSSVPMPQRYDAFNGTSMATPHVAGCAALWANATGARGAQLWQLLISRALPLPRIPAADAGAGLVQAPTSSRPSYVTPPAGAPQQRARRAKS